MLRWSFIFILYVSFQTPISDEFPIDKSILNEGACQLPCWNGIIPGETTLDNVNEFLEPLDFFASATEAEQNYFDNTELWILFWYHASIYEANRITLFDKVVETIEIYPNIEITMEDALALYGEPEMIEVDHHTRGFYPNTKWVSLSLIYPKHGLVIIFEIDDIPRDVNTVKITSNLVSQHFKLYRAADDLIDFLECRHSGRFNLYRNSMGYYEYIGWLGWPGYDAIVQFPDIPTSDSVYIFPPTPIP